MNRCDEINWMLATPWLFICVVVMMFSYSFVFVQPHCFIVKNDGSSTNLVETSASLGFFAGANAAIDYLIFAFNPSESKPIKQSVYCIAKSFHHVWNETFKCNSNELSDDMCYDKFKTFEHPIK